MSESLQIQELRCPLCRGVDAECLTVGVRDQEYAAPGEYSWLRCRGCQLVRIDPIPTPEILAKAYPEDYHAYVAPRSAITRWLRDRSVLGLAKTLARHLPKGGAVLDVGCSNGDLLAAIGDRGDFERYGVEYHSGKAEEARARGITVWQGDLEDADLPSETMDLVVMQHVLEHVFDPVRSLQLLFGSIRPGGALRGELPNHRSWDASLFGRYWGGGHAPRHIWHFTPSTLRRVLESCGFVDVRLSPSLHTGHWALSLQNVLRRNSSGCDGLTSGRTWYYPLFLLMTIPINILQMPILRTGVMRFSARKPA